MLLPDASLLTDIPYGATIQSMLLKTICTKGKKKEMCPCVCIQVCVCVCASCAGVQNTVEQLVLHSVLFNS